MADEIIITDDNKVSEAVVYINACPHCGAHPQYQEVRNYDMMWHDGDVYCTKCDGYVRRYDAG